MGNNFHSINAKIGVLRKGILKQSDYDKILSFEQRHEIVIPIFRNDKILEF